jgi:hypothetical protein
MEEQPQTDHCFKSSVVKHAALSLSSILFFFLVGASAIFENSTSKLLLQDHDTVRHLRYTAGSSERFLADQMDTNITSCTIDCCRQFESAFCGSDNEWIKAIPFALQIMIMILLVSLSALFSGLTLVSNAYDGCFCFETVP